MNSASDILSAESLLFAILGVVFGLWYEEIVSATHVEIPLHKEDCAGALRFVRAALFAKTLPLAILTLVVFLTFAPVSFDIVTTAIVHLNHSGLQDISTYSAVNVALLTVSFMTAVFAIYVVGLASKLNVVRASILRVQRGTTHEPGGY